MASAPVPRERLLEDYPSSDSLVDNNIFQQVTTPVAIDAACSGCVLAYNFDVDDIFDSGGGVYDWMTQGVSLDAVGEDNILIEGNQGAGFESDDIHGTHHFITVFRNAYDGYQQNNGQLPTGNIVPVILSSYSRFYNVVGNVLGSATLPHNIYEDSMADPHSGDESPLRIVYSIGRGQETPDDANVERTLMRWGNYDVVTANVRWCGDAESPGWSTICASQSEVPSGIASYANPVPSSTALPASFYLGQRPGWWPSGKPWPAIGPDVTGGNLQGSGGHANTIPAADCYANVMHGPADGTAGVLGFNRQACYGE